MHGWSDESKSFEPLARFLAAHGYKPVPIWLSDYISMEDDVKITDVAKRMQAVLEGMWQRGELGRTFDMIVHSTGGLVAREWLSAYYLNRPEAPPVKRLVMLAPANHGSKLASLGQSMLGRVVKGWKNWFHTGKEMLRALELASPYQWALAQRDLFAESPADQRSIYGEQRVWPFVIIGTHPYTDLLRQIVNEDGSDGTVRVPAANLNSFGGTLDFTGPDEVAVMTPLRRRFDADIPFAVLPYRTHESITLPDESGIDGEPADQKDVLGRLILDALACDSFARYRQIAGDWRAIAEATAAVADQGIYHQYVQVNVFVVDDHGAPVEDYFVEFIAPDHEQSDAATVYFHQKVIEDVHNNSASGAYRCLLVGRTDLMRGYYPRVTVGYPKVVTMSLSANPPGNNVQYFSDFKEGAKGEFMLHNLEVEDERILKRNTTHYVKIVIPRCPHDPVFQLRRFVG